MGYDLYLYRKGIKNHKPVYYQDCDNEFNVTFHRGANALLDVLLGKDCFTQWNNRCCCVFYNKLKRAYAELERNKELYKRYTYVMQFNMIDDTLKNLGRLIDKIEELNEIDGMEHVYLEVC